MKSIALLILLCVPVPSERKRELDAADPCGVYVAHCASHGIPMYRVTVSKEDGSYVARWYHIRDSKHHFTSVWWHQDGGWWEKYDAEPTPANTWRWFESGNDYVDNQPKGTGWTLKRQP